MRDRTPYTNEELIEMADQIEEFCPRRAATYRELARLRTRKDAQSSSTSSTVDANEMIFFVVESDDDQE